MLIKKVATRKQTRKQEVENAMKCQFNLLHSLDHFQDVEIEELLLQQKEFELERLKNRLELPEGIIKFTPSGSSKCDRDLFYKAVKVEADEDTAYPFQRRWTKNSTAVHERVQTDLLYSEKLLPSPSFRVHRLENGLPAWERNIERCKVINHNGVEFVLHGMMDGVVQYQKDNSDMGFEFKTKSHKYEAVAKMTSPSPSHRLQCVAYSILFGDMFENGLDEFIICYESVAKDSWMANDTAIDDIKCFYVKVTEEQKTKLLDKFARVVMNIENGELAEQDTTKCLFCKYKKTCLGSEINE